MDTALFQKFPFILDRNLAKANCTGNRICTSCDLVVLGYDRKQISFNSIESSSNHKVVNAYGMPTRKKIVYCLQLI